VDPERASYDLCQGEEGGQQSPVYRGQKLPVDPLRCQEEKHWASQLIGCPGLKEFGEMAAQNMMRA